MIVVEYPLFKITLQTHSRNKKNADNPIAGFGIGKTLVDQTYRPLPEKIET